MRAPRQVHPHAACAGGDAFISICLWQAGYAVSDPGYSFYHPEVQMFDPGPEDRMGVMLKLVRALDSNRCDARCRVRATSLEVRPRDPGSPGLPLQAARCAPM